VAIGAPLGFGTQALALQLSQRALGARRNDRRTGGAYHPT